MATRYIDNSTIKRLFADSKGICAKCDNDLFPNGDLLGEICHIEAYSPGGNRYNKLLKSGKKENQYENLIVLCSNCHKTIDLKKNEDLYDTNYLVTLKVTHQQKTIFKTSSEIDDNKIANISNKFQQSIENELVEIKSLLVSITGNHCFEILQEKFKRKRSFYPLFENINTFFFSTEDLTLIDTIKRGTEQDLPKSYILIGPPSSGKTTLILKIANELPEIFTHFYLSLNEAYKLDTIRKDLKYIKNFQSVIYLDDCHLNNELACEIYYECANYINITLIFLYREINEVSRVSESGYNLFNNTVSQVFIIDPFTNQKEKINTLIENRRKKILDTKSINANIGDIETVYKFIDKNLLKLTLLLDEWENEPTEILDRINDRKLNRLLYTRFLKARYEKEERDFLKTYTAVNKFEIPFKILDNTNLESQLIEDALVNRNDEQYFEFFHSSFANLLLSSLISEDSKFELMYPKGITQFEKVAFKNYFKLLSEINPEKYPYKIAFILNMVIANQGFDLFKFLVRDEEIKKQIVKYFKSVNDNEQYSLFFRNIAVSCSNQYNYYYSQIVDSTKLNQLLNSTPKNIKEFKTILYILRDKSYSRYKEVIQKLPKEEIKKMILASRLNDITFTIRYISDFDRPFAELLIADINTNEWISLFNQASVSTISNSTIELKQLKNREFASGILNQIETDKIINSSKREPIENITKSIKELSEINEGIAKKIANSITEKFLIEKIANQPIGKISKCLQELYPYKRTELKSVVGKLNDYNLILEFENYNLSNIGRILSELYDINNEKISELTTNQKFQELLQNKLSLEDNPEQIGKTIADLNKVQPKSAILFVSNLTFDKIKNLIDKSSFDKFSVFIYSIFSTKGNKELSIQIFKSIPSKILAAKTFHKHFKITHFEPTFSQLNKVSSDKTKEILNCIPDKILITKSIDFQVSARKVSQSLKSLNFINPEKLKYIVNILFSDSDFNKKIDNLSKTDLIHTFANFSAIDIEKSKDKFVNKIESITHRQLKNEEISSFSDGLKLLKKNSVLSKNSSIIKTFESHLIENYKHFRLRQISIALINLHFIDQIYTTQLIEKLDIKILSLKAIEMDNEENLNGCLGEIRIVNPKYFEQLTKEINNTQKAKR
jgi:hypothetical protein